MHHPPICDSGILTRHPQIWLAIAKLVIESDDLELPDLRWQIRFDHCRSVVAASRPVWK